MNKEQFKAEVTEIFTNSKAETLLITSDGHVFKTTDKGFCKQHCDTFNLTFEEQTLEEFLKNTDKELVADVTATVDFSKLDELTQPELSKLATSLGVVSDSKKKVDLIEALVAYNDSLSSAPAEETADDYKPAGAPEGDDSAKSNPE